GVIPAAELPYAYYNSLQGGTVTTLQANPVLQPGQYAVVGPRALTYLGSQDANNVNPPPNPPSIWGGNSKQYIQLASNPQNFVVTDTSGNVTSRIVGTDMRAVVPIICDMYAG